MQPGILAKTTGILMLAGLCAACALSAREAFGPRLDQAAARGVPILVYTYGVPGEIAVGKGRTAVPVYIQFVVTGERSLRRVQFLFVGYSRRGHPVRQSNGKIRALSLKSTANFEPDRNYEVNSFHARPAGFPGGNVACIKLVRVKLFYAEATSRDR